MKKSQVILSFNILPKKNHKKPNPLELASHILHLRNEKSGSSLIRRLLLGPSLWTIWFLKLCLSPKMAPM